MMRTKALAHRRICAEMEHGPVMRLKASLEVFNCWDSVRGADDAPQRADVDPAAIRHILSQIFILEIAPDDELRFRLAGTMACNLFGRELRGDLFSSLWGQAHANVAEATAREVMSKIAPMLIDAIGRTRLERNVGFEIALLPMRSSTGCCDRLLGCIAPDTHGAWIGSDVMVDLAAERRHNLSDQPYAETAEAVERRSSAWTWRKSSAGLEAVARRALHLMVGGERSLR
jgi:hypothetical protein